MKPFKIVGISTIAFLTIVSAMISFSGPQLPEDSDRTIGGVLKSDLPEFLKGKTGYVYPENTTVWYESICKDTSTRGAILLFMGIANDALSWPQGFIDLLVEAGYQVIRFDYRGTGMSGWMPDLEHPLYSLTDLALDAKLILDALQISKAHLVGVSMGGMVAQAFAIHFPKRTLTLTSIMSSGNVVDKKIKGASKKVAFDLAKIGFKYGVFPTERNIIKMHVAARLILRGEADYRIDVKGTAEQVLYNLRKRNGFNPLAFAQHYQAVRRSGSRYAQLRKLEIPSLVIHGQKDPFIPIDHSKKLASVLSYSKTKWFANMGHDIPPGLHDALTVELIKQFERNPE
ncbi:MAG: alpha/beta hydrolase [Desulfatitalea sp.]|nr:alpha/beta hydrolase [Desulfatitalea sp.]NNK00639.1 alpha/beta hydrolase [Desulfatitalea sp.]